VDCRIEVVRGSAGVVVHLAGRLRHAQVPDLIETCVRAGVPLSVDLSELISADAVGLDALVRIREMGAELAAVPTYLHLKIESLTQERPPKPRPGS
jgi:anti-anti-sigma regulatory factor